MLISGYKNATSMPGIYADSNDKLLYKTWQKMEEERWNKNWVQ